VGGCFQSGCGGCSYEQEYEQEELDHIMKSKLSLMQRTPRMAGNTTMTKEAPPASLTIQAKQCTTIQCGTDPHGKKQGYMIDPADCDDLEFCFNVPIDDDGIDDGIDDGGPPIVDCYKYLFCAEDIEIEKTILLTNYECIGDEDDNICDIELPGP
jgi:hypothetical protein